MLRKLFKSLTIKDVIYSTIFIMVLFAGFYYLYKQNAYSQVRSYNDYSKSHDFEVEDRILQKL